MIKINQIDSIRSFEQYPSYLILYEFEDDFSKQLDIPISKLSMFRYITGKFVYKYFERLLANVNHTNKRKFSIMMTPDYHRLYLKKSNVIPYVIDYWKRYDVVFEKHFVHFPIVYISGLEVYEYLKVKNTKVNIKHLPLSVSDRHLSIFYKETIKDIDIINVGRKNKIIDGYIQLLLKKFPEINYVHREMENNENIYYSSKHGKIGKLESRADLLQTLARSKIAIVTSPGIDGGEQRTGGFNPVTPRVFEAAIGKCYMIGKYVRNAEYYNFGLDKIVEMPESYEEFEKLVLKKINSPFSMHIIYEEFLKNNLNSRRIEQIKNDLKV